MIDPADVPLLQYAYSENMQAGLVGAMIKCLSSVYGLSLPTGPLRYAVLALSSLCLNGRLDVEPIQDYFRKTRVSLITRLASPHVVDETDLLATFILALLESLRSPSREIRIYVQGCSSVLQSLVSNSRVSVVLKVFGPLVFDYLSLIQFWSQSDPTETFRARRHIIFGQRNLFLQRLNYIQTSQVCYVGKEWYSSVGGAIQSTALVSFEVLLHLLAKSLQSAGETRGELEIFCLQVVKAQHYDPDFQSALNASRQWHQKGPIE